MYYKEMYLQLFDATTKAIEALTKAQQEAEKLYIHQEIPFTLAKLDDVDDTVV